MKIGFIADIHEDIESLLIAFNIFDKLNCETIVCLGDIVGFAIPFQRFIEKRNANACIDIICKRCAFAVAGNHDLFAVKRTPKFTAGFQYGDNWYEMDYEVREKLSKNKIWFYEDSELPHDLTPQSEEYLRSLPEYCIKTIDGIQFLFSHFNYPDLSGSKIDYPKKIKDLKEHFQFMIEQNCLISVSGHGHPEGFGRSNQKKGKVFPFGLYQLEREIQWLVCPCVANTSRANGVMIFDTTTFQLEVIPLCSHKIIV